MKRPGSFDRPPSPSRSQGGKGAAVPSRAQETGPGKPAGGSPGEANTEPIAVQDADLAPVAGIRPKKTGAPSGEKSGAAVADAVLRGARRARKRFERAEVRRFTWRSRRRRTIWFVSLGASVVLLGGVVAAAYSPLMAVRTIEVVGTNRVGAQQVVAALDDQLGTPLPLIDFSRVKEQLSSFMLIESFVTESRPPGTLVVRIVEREPIGVITSDTGFDLVDAAGVRIDSSVERPAGYPQIEAPDGVDSAGFLAAGEVVHALPASIRSELDAVAAATTDDVTLTLIGGAKVVWGSAEQSELKAVVLAALMVGHPTGSVNEYDVSSPNSAVLR